MQAGLYRLKRLGIMKLTQPVGLASAMNQLPDEAIELAAASHIERELQIASWNLTSNFVACTNQVLFNSCVRTLIISSSFFILLHFYVSFLTFYLPLFTFFVSDFLLPSPFSCLFLLPLFFTFVFRLFGFISSLPQLALHSKLVR
jgi:hypothetical protein